jgi:hypothetical protein
MAQTSLRNCALMEGWGQLNNQKLHDLRVYTLANIIGVIISKRRWAGNVACMEENISVYRVCAEET